MTQMAKIVEAEVRDRFRLPAPTLMSHFGKTPLMAFSHIHGNGLDQGRTKPVKPEDAYTVNVVLRDLEKFRLWIDGREIAVPNIQRGGIALFHFEADPVVGFGAEFDFLRCYISKATIDQMAEEAGRPRPEGLRRPDHGAQDPIFHHLAQALVPLFRHEPIGAQLVIDQIAQAFCSRLLHAYGGRPRDERTLVGRMAPWQERRAKDFIEANLGRDASLSEIAAECEISTSHLSRAFRNSTGRSPHRWLIERRIELAKNQLSDQDRPLREIAEQCGFADASHMSRVFHRLIGETPGKWRRNRRH